MTAKEFRKVWPTIQGKFMVVEYNRTELQKLRLYKPKLEEHYLESATDCYITTGVGHRLTIRNIKCFHFPKQ